MEARSQLRHRPTCCRDATSLLSPLEGVVSNVCRWRSRTNGTIIEVGSWMKQKSEMQLGLTVCPVEISHENGRDREHLRGVPVSNTIEGVGPLGLIGSPISRALGSSLCFR